MSDDLLRALAAKDAIADVVTRLFVATDTRDWAAVEQCLAPSVLLDMTSLAGGAPASLAPGAITAMWNEGFRTLQAVHHQIGNLRITVSDDRATASCYGIATHYRPTASGRDVRTFVGSYDLGLVRMAADWRIDELRFNLKYVDGNLELERDPSPS
jgi:hypothetical protein